jgi:signal transduction histidine kinase
MDQYLTPENSTIWVLALLGFLALVTGSRAVARRGLREPVVRLLVLYLILAFLWELGAILINRSIFPFLNQDITRLYPLFGALILAILFLGVSSAFLNTPIKIRNWIILGLALCLLSLLLATHVLPIPRIPLTLGAIPFYRRRVIQVILLLGWILITGRTMQLILSAYRLANRPLHKNRVVFWALSVLIAFVGDMLIFPGFHQGGLLHLLSGCIAGYVLISHNLADVVQLGLRGFSYLMISLLAAVVYAIGFLTLQNVLKTSPGLKSMETSLVLGGILAFIFNPLIILLIRRMDRVVHGLRYDPSGTVREYSQSISNIVNLDFLAKTALSLLGKTFHTGRTYLFLVDEEKVAGQGFFNLRMVKAADENAQVEPIRMSADSPAAAFFSQARLPLAQYDLDLLPQFKDTPPEDRSWFTGLEVDMYVPICTKTQWIGLFILGPKSTRERYFDEDLVLLTTLADQTAVALENARLFSNLVKVNQDLVQAQRALEEANQHLREIDELKSAFIGVITHEMRTPLANIAFSLQLLGMYGKDMNPEQREQLGQLNLGVKQARSLVENLITFATFLNKQAVITPEPLDFGMLIKDTLIPLEELACEKEVLLKVDIMGELLPVNGDRKHLAIAIYQLVHNSIKFNRPKGRVWVTCWSTSNALYFDVKDTGVGVARSKLATLWSGFTQAADPLRRGLEGLGLGLALVKNIVAAHGGQVWADSWEGKGSVFGFQIPLEPLAEVANPAEVFQIRTDLPKPQEGYFPKR